MEIYRVNGNRSPLHKTTDCRNLFNKLNIMENIIEALQTQSANLENLARTATAKPLIAKYCQMSLVLDTMVLELQKDIPCYKADA